MLRRIKRYFLEFIGWAGGQEILFFWLAIEVSNFL